MKLILLMLGVLVVILVAAQFLLASQFTAKIADLGQRLAQAQPRESVDTAGIPEVIRAFALRNGARQGGPSVIAMAQSVEMRLSPDQPFFPLSASQLSTSGRPGFVWQATGNMGGFIPLQVVDSYVGGAGDLEVRILGSITVAKASGPETAVGEAMRFLAELPWNPDAILNAEGLEWRQIDDQTVEVSTNTEGGIASVTLLLDAAGDIVGARAQNRPRSGDTPAPWLGRFRDYAQIGAYRFPRFGEVAWDLPGGEFVYWRGEITRVEPAAGTLPATEE